MEKQEIKLENETEKVADSETAQKVEQESKNETKQESKKDQGNLLTVLIICAIIGYITFLFAFVKEGYHSDEPWSYGYSNGYYEGLYYLEQDQTTPRHIYKWMEGKDFNEYLSVSPEHRFCYDSIIYNLQQDMTVSPLYYCTLHTICSFFPGTFTWWYAFIINLVALTVFLIFLYKLCYLIAGKRSFAWMGTALIGFSTGMQSCFIYIRPYALTMMWGMLLLYLQMKLYKKDFKKIGKELVAIFAVVLLGSLTQSFFFLLAFFLAMFTDFYLLFTRKWKAMCLYSASMLAAVGISYLVWPKVFNSATDVEAMYKNRLPFMEEVRKAGYLFGGETIGIPLLFPTKFFNAILLGVVFVIVMLIVASWFLFRKDEWFIKLKEKLTVSRKKAVAGCKGTIVKSNKMLWIFALTLDAAFLVNIPIEAGYLNMNVWVDRYFFFLMPIFSILVWYAIYFVCGHFAKTKAKNRAMVLGALLVGVLVLSNQLIFASNYFFDDNSDTGVSLKEAVKGKDVILIVDSDWQMIYYMPVLKDADQVLVMRNSEVMEIPLEIWDRELDDACLVIQTTYLRDDNAEPEEFSAEALIRALRTYEFSEEELLMRLGEFSFVNQIEYVAQVEGYTGLVHIFNVK